MPIEVGIWKIEKDESKKIVFESIEIESRLEDILYKDISILSDEYLIIGRQIRTSYGKTIDLLTIDETGKLTVVELKRNKTPRDVVAQAIDYASWVLNLSYREVRELFNENNDQEFEQGFEEKFGISPPEKINQEHDMLIVCSELDNETERIINYLSDNYNVPINAVFFRFFKENNSEFLSRTWLIDPSEVEEKSSRSASQGKGESWNGRDFVANIDVDDNGLSTWNDSVKYGFISAGGGKWYIQSLNKLQPGHRVFAMIPTKGYIGVGTVEDKSVSIRNFQVEQNGATVSILDLPLEAEFIKKNEDDPEKCEHLVRVKWIKTVPENEAYWVKGLRANQNSAFKLKSSFTLEKLQSFFNLDD